jgi:hypothetical protein
MTIGTRVKTISFSFGESSNITTISNITTNSLGTVLYSMENGQLLSVDEFNTY